MIFSENQPIFLKVGSAVQKFSGKEWNSFFRQNHMLMIYKNTFCLKFLYSSLFEIWKKDQPIANIELCNLGTYFNCIMFMVASSVVTTIMILNYHHRLADTHEMPPWVSITEDLKMVRPLERLLLTANLKSNKLEKVAWALAESIPKKFLKIQGPYMLLKLLSKDF